MAENDIVVVARQGYRALLNVGPNNLDIDCYTPVNLSAMFSAETLDTCASLRAHLEDGNLIHYKDNQTLPKDASAVEIKPLGNTSSTKIGATYSQKTETPMEHMQVETKVVADAGVNENMQAKVAKGRDEILANDQKILESSKKTKVIDVGSRPTRQESMTSEQLQMEVKMDVDPTEFKKRQKDTYQQLQNKNQADDDRAMQEIADAEADQQS